MSIAEKRPGRVRRWLAPALVGSLAGAGITAALFYSFRGANGPRSSAPSHVAGQPVAPPSPGDPGRPKKDGTARQVAEEFLRALTRKDAPAMAAVCDIPYLGGPFGNPRLTADTAGREKSLKEDLCQGYGPYMFEAKWDVREVLPPADFQERYADYLRQDPNLGKPLADLKLTPDDRVVVEKERGMLLLVRVRGEEARVVGVVPVGFRPRPFHLVRDVIYGRRYGAALTLDVLRPLKEGNRAAVLQVVSDTFVSFPPPIGGSLTLRTQGLLDAGYTVFFVTHSGSPKSTVPDTVADVHRAVRFIRYHAARFQVDPDRLSIMGASSGGYLALMVGVAGGKGPSFPPPPDPTGAQQRGDPVEAASSRVRAVVSYFPPTDWLNYGEAGKTVFDYPVWRRYHGVLDLYEFDAGKTRFDRVTDRARILKELKGLSPAQQVGRHAAPALIFHGERDRNVPLQQSERMVGALQRAGVPAELVVKPGAGHGWADTADDTAKVIAWLDRFLVDKK